MRHTITDARRSLSSRLRAWGSTIATLAAFVHVVEPAATPPHSLDSPTQGFGGMSVQVSVKSLRSLRLHTALLIQLSPLAVFAVLILMVTATIAILGTVK